MSPCHDGRSIPTESRASKQERARLEACLCALSTVLEERNTLNDVLDGVDWEECGVSMNWFISWWESHKARDLLRKERERAERERKQLAKKALEKLSPEERNALGLSNGVYEYE